MDTIRELDVLAGFLATQDAQTLAQALLDLAEDHAPVAAFLERMPLRGDAAALTAAFTERLQHWATDHRYIRLDEASGFGHGLDVWVAEVQREVLPRFPAEAMGLLAAFLELDNLFERVGDDGAYIGGSFELACRLWLSAAQAAGLPADDIRERASALLAKDCYGVRGALRAALGPR